jgi:hypothetical protein
MPIPSSVTLWLRDVPIRANSADALKSIGTRWLQYALHTVEAHGSISPYFFCKLELLHSCHVACSTITAWRESKAVNVPAATVPKTKRFISLVVLTALCNALHPDMPMSQYECDPLSVPV